jgi:hypothetical protein
MDVVSVRIITDNLDVTVEFYEKVTGITADRPAPVFAELHCPSCTLALGHTSTASLFNNAASPPHDKTAIIEGVVDDVDTEPLVTAVSSRCSPPVRAAKCGPRLERKSS